MWESYTSTHVRGADEEAGNVIAELLPDWEHRLSGLSESRKRAVVSASTRLARWGFLASRAVSATPTTDLGKQLLADRMLRPGLAGSSPRRPESGHPPALTPDKQHSLAEVAKSGKWLQIDRAATYR